MSPTLPTLPVPRPGIIAGENLSISIDGQLYLIKPYFRPDGNVDFWLQNGNTVFILSDTKDEYIKEGKSTTEFAKPLSILYELKDVLLNKNALLQDFEQILSNRGTVSVSNGKFSLNINGGVFGQGQGGGGNQKVISRFELCEIVKRWNVRNYVNKLGFANALTNTYEHIVENAMNNCGGFSCAVCNDPTCVFEQILVQLNIPPVIPEEVTRTKRNYLKYLLDLTETQVNFLANNISEANHLYSLLTNNIQTASDEEKCEMISIAKQSAQMASDQVFVDAVQAKLNVEPNFFVETCVNVTEWSYLVNYIIPATVNASVASVEEFSIQSINDPVSSCVNLDYFPVNINTLPKLNGTVLTNEALIQYFRLHINNFTDGTDFSPFLYPFWDDTALWQSNNPLGAKVNIEINGDYGAVVTSNYYTSGWFFSTLKTPYLASGGHPVSGNRDFGIGNFDGNNIFYTKGADRLSNTLVGSTLLTAELAFYFADKLWTKTCAELVKFINTHNGNAVAGTPIKGRTYWSLIYKCFKDNSDNLSNCQICQ